MSDKKSPKEAMEIFTRIIKASVSVPLKGKPKPKKTIKKK